MSEATITESKNSWALLAGIVDRPSATLAEITAHPRWRWVLPVTLAILATVASAIVTAPYLAAEAKLQMAAVLNRMPAEQLAQMPKQMATLQTPLFVGASAALTGILVPAHRLPATRRPHSISARSSPAAKSTSDGSSLQPPGSDSPSCWNRSCRPFTLL